MKQNKNKKINKNTILRVNAFMVLALVATFMIHLLVTNNVSNQRYQLASAHSTFDALSDEKQKLTLQLVELQSSDRLNAESQRMQLVKVDKIQYIEPRGAVALNK